MFIQLPDLTETYSLSCDNLIILWCEFAAPAAALNLHCAQSLDLFHFTLNKKSAKENNTVLSSDFEFKSHC